MPAGNMLAACSWTIAAMCSCQLPASSPWLPEEAAASALLGYKVRRGGGGGTTGRRHEYRRSSVSFVHAMDSLPDQRRQSAASCGGSSARYAALNTAPLAPRCTGCRRRFPRTGQGSREDKCGSIKSQGLALPSRAGFPATFMRLHPYFLLPGHLLPSSLPRCH